MKKAVALLAVVFAIGSAAVFDAEAKRLGGGKSGGMQRQNISAPAQTSGGGAATNGRAAQAAPAAGTAAAAGAPAAAAAKRSWMGPLAGLAAGLGLAALASHLGFGEAFANMMLIGLAVMAVLLVVGLVMRKRAVAQGGALAGAGAPFGGAGPTGRPGSLIGSRIGPAAASARGIPADFDAAAFARNAETQFMSLQAANDAGDLDGLRSFLSPELFDVVRTEVAEREARVQKTEVFGLHAQVLDVLQEGGEHIVSVRFTGSVRDQQGAVPEELNEVWHLTKPVAGQGGWMVAGIQQGD